MDIIDHCQLFLVKEFIHDNIVQYLTETSRYDLYFLNVTDDNQTKNISQSFPILLNKPCVIIQKNQQGSTYRLYGLSSETREWQPSDNLETSAFADIKFSEDSKEPQLLKAKEIPIQVFHEINRKKAHYTGPYQISIILTNHNQVFFIKNDGLLRDNDEKLCSIIITDRGTLPHCEFEYLIRIEEPNVQIQKLMKEILKKSNLLPLDFMLKQRNKFGDTILTFALQSKCYRLVQAYLPFMNEDVCFND